MPQQKIITEPWINTKFGTEIAESLALCQIWGCLGKGVLSCDFYKSSTVLVKTQVTINLQPIKKDEIH